MLFWSISSGTLPLQNLISFYIECRKALNFRMIVGGVLALEKDVMFKINGFSNILFGWGGEDVEAYMRYSAFIS